MTVRVGWGHMAASLFPFVATLRLGTAVMVVALLSACGYGSGEAGGEESAAPLVMSSRKEFADERSDGLRIRVEAWGNPGPTASNSLTQSEKELPASQVSACWTPPVGITDPAESVVQLKLSMNRDGTVQRLEVVDQGKMAESPSLRALAESAIKAVMRCVPLSLPPDKYDQWRVFVMYFDAARSVQR